MADTVASSSQLAGERGEDEVKHNGNGKKKPEDGKVFGIIPQEIKGDFGCIGCKFIKYFVNPTVMLLSVVIIWSFVIWCAVDENAATEIGKMQDAVTKYFGWFYISSLITFGLFATYLVFSRFGDIKLGHPDKPPKYSILTWFSMLFSAGVGVGLYFFGVAEPIFHFADMQAGNSRWYEGSINEQAMDALNVSWFHWGLTASAIYCVAALPLAYQHHVLGQPLRESICFVPLIGKKYADGIIGQLIDLTSVIGTMFGVATSLGLGVLQINAGLAFIFNVKQDLKTQLIIIWVITLCATGSVLTGLDAGIRRLSEINFGFSFILVFFMFFAGDAFYLLNLFIQGIGYHIQWIFELTFSTQAFEQEGFYDTSDGSQPQDGWMSGWTIFYWAWWIAWAPFVGIFIAQISEGRTVREFIIGNMLVPTLFTSIWLTIFGGVGLYNELASIQNDIDCETTSIATSDDDVPNATWFISTAAAEDDWYSEYNGRKVVKLSCYGTADMLFALLSTLPLSTTMSILALVGILTYFVTSSDSASHVIDVLTANGNEEPPKLQRIFWAFSEGAVASVLLGVDEEGGSLRALQTASLVAALPFCVVLLFEVLATYKTLRIHLGELKPEELVYWRYDIFECGNYYTSICIALICPPYYQMKTRLKLITLNEAQLNREDIDGVIRYVDGYADNAFKWVWIVAYFLLWFITILFCLLEYAQTGFLYLGLTFYLFWIILCVGNRNMIKEYYEIDSSNVLFDILSWMFCCCCAAVQEDLQSDLDVSRVQQSDDATELKLKQSIKNNDNVYQEETDNLLSQDNETNVVAAEEVTEELQTNQQAEDANKPANDIEIEKMSDNNDEEIPPKYDENDNGAGENLIENVDANENGDGYAE